MSPYCAWDKLYERIKEKKRMFDSWYILKNLIFSNMKYIIVLFLVCVFVCVCDLLNWLKTNT